MSEHEDGRELEGAEASEALGTAMSRIAALVRAREQAAAAPISDTDRIEYLEALNARKDYTGRCVLRQSTTGRGWRLHETEGNGVGTVREAIDLEIRRNFRAPAVAPELEIEIDAAFDRGFAKASAALEQFRHNAPLVQAYNNLTPADIKNLLEPATVDRLGLKGASISTCLGVLSREVERAITLAGLLSEELKATEAALERARAQRAASIEYERKWETTFMELVGEDGVGSAAAAVQRIIDERARLDALINSPEIHNFALAVELEAAHQRERWPADQDAGKTDADWFWLIGHLAAKAMHNPCGPFDDSTDKRLHRVITIAAAAANWHAHIAVRSRKPLESFTLKGTNLIAEVNEALATSLIGSDAEMLYRSVLESVADALAGVPSVEAIAATAAADATEERTRAANPAGTEVIAVAGFDFLAHLRRQRAFSERTFGPDARLVAVIDHIRKELLEIEAEPAKLSEWIDVAILALDGAWRAGHSPEAIVAALVAKQTKNEGRTWPDWRTADPDKAIEHVRAETPAQAEPMVSPTKLADSKAKELVGQSLYEFFPWEVSQVVNNFPNWPRVYAGLDVLITAVRRKALGDALEITKDYASAAGVALQIDREIGKLPRVEKGGGK